MEDRSWIVQPLISIFKFYLLPSTIYHQILSPTVKSVIMKNFFLKTIHRLLRGYATKVIRRHQPFIIAVTGSVGKSSTKEAIYRVLKDRYKGSVWRNSGNLNTEIGVPLTILGYNKVPSPAAWPFFLIAAYFRTFMKDYPKYLILEMGIDKPGDMAYLTGIAEPDMAVITSLGLAHLAYFKSKDQYKQEKLLILKALKEDGKAFLNGDDRELAGINDSRIKLVGLSNRSADYRAADFKLSLEGTEYRLLKTGKKISIKTALVGAHLAYAQLFAFAVGDGLAIPSLQIAASLEKMKPTPGRMSVLPGKDGTMIIDDTYNAASPASVKAALDFLADLPSGKKKIFILGNMNELGDFGREIHREVAVYARGKCDLAVFAGPEAEKMKSVFGAKALAFGSRHDLDAALDSFVQKDDIILIKASQNRNFFEETVKKLMRNPEEADKLLVRQDSYWLKKKRRC